MHKVFVLTWPDGKVLSVQVCVLNAMADFESITNKDPSLHYLVQTWQDGKLVEHSSYW